MELPIYCFDCGVELQGGATRHAPSCWVLAVIAEYFPVHAAALARLPDNAPPLPPGPYG